MASFNNELNKEKQDNSSSLQLCLNEKIKELESTFLSHKNVDFAKRKIFIKAISREGALVFLNGMADSKTIEHQIISPLLKNKSDFYGEDYLGVIEKQIVSVKRVTNQGDIKKISSMEIQFL
jgi:hypothetical protein